MVITVFYPNQPNQPQWLFFRNRIFDIWSCSYKVWPWLSLVAYCLCFI